MVCTLQNVETTVCFCSWLNTGAGTFSCRAPESQEALPRCCTVWVAQKELTPAKHHCDHKDKPRMLGNVERLTALALPEFLSMVLHLADLSLVHPALLLLLCACVLSHPFTAFTFLISSFSDDCLQSQSQPH